MRLRPCSACARHALLGSTSCPFCAATLACFVEPPGSYVGRVTRAAVFAGAVLAAPAAGCASGPHARYEQLPPADSDTAVPTGVVKGRVLRDDGSAASGRSVMLIGTGLRALRGSESITSNAQLDGDFTFDHIPPGEYQLSADGKHRYKVTVRAGQAAILTIELPRPPHAPAHPMAKPYGAPPARRRQV